MRGPTRVARALLIGAAAVAARSAHGAECTPTTGQSTCIAADALWTPAAPSSFAAIPAARSMKSGAWSVGGGLSYLSRPLVLHTASPDPDGRSVLVVDDVVGASLLGAVAPAPGLELTLALPFAVYRTGTGVSGVTSQGGPSLQPAALGDVRLGAGYEVLSSAFGRSATTASAMLRLDLALPTGTAAFAGDRGPTIAPSLDAEVRHRDFVLSAALGARLRMPAPFGGMQYGSQLVSALGIASDFFDPGRTTLALEMFVLPSLPTQGRTSAGGAHFDASFVPAEWLASVERRFGDVSVRLGLGTALPFSSETRTDPDGRATTDTFAAPTSPRFRALLQLRYAGRANP